MNILKKIVIIAISFVFVLSLIQQDNYSANGSIAAQNGNEVSSDHSSPENSGLPVDTQEPEITWTPIETAHPSETEVPVESILPEPTELPTETEEPEDLPVIAPTEDSFLVDEGMMVENSSASMMSADLLTITTNKPVAPNTWEYWEDTEALNVVITIGKDNTLPAGTIREIVFDVDESRNSTVSTLYIADYPKNLSSQIKKITLNPDKRSVIYEIDNDALPASGITVSFYIDIERKSTYTTTYYKSAGTMAGAIGFMLLKDPNWRLLFSVLDKSTNSKKIEEIKLKRDGLDENTPLISGVKFQHQVGNTATYKQFSPENDLFVSSSGDIIIPGTDKHFRGQNILIYLDLFTTTTGRSPISNIRVHNNGFVTKGPEVSVDVISGSPTDQRFLSLVSIKPISGKFEIMLNRDNLVKYPNISELAPNTKIDLGDLVVSYDQVMSNGDGTYRIERKTQTLAKAKANVPEFVGGSGVYFFSHFNNIQLKVDDENPSLIVTGSDGRNLYDEIPHHFEKGKLTINAPSDFILKSISIKDDGIKFDNYKLIYSDGSETEWIPGKGGQGYILQTPKKSDDIKVVSVVMNLINQKIKFKRISNGSTPEEDFVLNGSFVAGSKTGLKDAIVTLESGDGSIKYDSKLQWNYVKLGDWHRLNLYTLGNAAYNTFFLDGESSYLSFELYRYPYESRLYKNIRYEVLLEEPLNELLNGRFKVYSPEYKGVGIEYTTNFYPNLKTIKIPDNRDYQGQIPLSVGEVITSLVFTASELRINKTNTSYKGFELGITGRRSSVPNLEENKRYYYKIKASAGDEFGGGGFDSGLKTYTSSLAVIHKAVGSLNDQFVNIKVESSDTVERNAVLDQVIVTLPRLGSLFPNGTKIYYKMNESFFRYVGQDPNVTIEKINGKTWVVHDVSGKKPNDKINYNNDFFATILCEDTTNYQIFEEAYLDIGPLINSNSDEWPYVDYKSNTSLLLKAVVDTEGITKGSNLDYTEKRLIPFDVSKTVGVVAASIDNINIFPGKKIMGESKVSHSGINYIASEYKDLIAEFTIASADKSYINYQLAIELPTKGSTYIDKLGASFTSMSDIRLDNLTDSVFVSDDYKGGDIQYCASFNFDGTTGTDIVTNCEKATTVNEAKYVLISIPKVDIGSLGVVELKLSALEDEIYELPHHATTYVSADARFYEQYPGEVTGNSVGKLSSKNFGEFKFNWFSLKGEVFYEHLNGIPNGIFSEFEGDAKTLSYFNKKGRLVDVNDGSKYAFETAVDNKYNVYIQPKKPQDSGQRYKHNVIVDLKEGTKGSATYLWDKFRISTNTSDHPNIKTNNNFPRQNNEQTEGIQFYADTQGMEAVKYVTQKEIEEGFVNIGLYQNPIVTMSPTIPTVKAGNVINLKIVKQGKENTLTSPEVSLVDGNTYAVVEYETTANKKEIIAQMSGIQETLTPTLVANNRKLVATFYNYFEDPIEFTFEYRVTKDPFVEFMLKAKDSDLTGTWADGDTEKAKDVGITSMTGAAIKYDEIPEIIAPEGYCFTGWSTRSYFYNLIGDRFRKYDKVYPLFEEDKKGALDSNFQPIGDEIPDKFQTEFIISVEQGGILTKDEITTEDTKAPISVFVTRLKSQKVNLLYPVAELNPENWIEKDGKNGVSLKAVDLPMASPINADYYEFVDWTIEEESYSDASEIEAKGAVFVEESYAIKANFFKKVATVTFLKNEVGQKSQKTEEVHINKGLSLTEDDLLDTLGIARKTPIYGWVFKNYLNTLTDEVIDGDEEAKRLVLNEDLSIQPQFIEEDYAVQFKISEPVMGEEYLDEYGNTLEEVLEDQIVPFNHKGELLEVPIVKPSENEKWKDLFKFSSWRYEMNCDTELTECIAGKTEGFIEDPKDLVITGDVTFHAEMIGKPFVAVTQNVGGKTVLEKMIEEDEIIDFNLDSLDKYKFTEEEKTVNFSKDETELLPGQYDVGFAAKADSNHRIHKITAQVYKNQPINSEIESVVLYENGELLKEALLEAFDKIPVSGDAITFEAKEDHVFIAIDDIGGKDSVPSGLVLEVEFAKIKKRVVFESGNRGVIDANNTDFIEKGGTIIEGKDAEISLEYGSTKMQFPKIKANAGYRFKHWILVEEQEKERIVTVEELTNMQLTSDLVFEAKYSKIVVPEPSEQPPVVEESGGVIDAVNIQPLPKENYTSYFDIKSGSWITLITCLASGILGLLVLLLKRHKQENQGAGIALYTRNNAFIYTATLVGLIAFTLALLTQEIGANRMLIDKYSFISVILLIVTILFVVLGMMWKKDVPKETTHSN